MKIDQFDWVTGLDESGWIAAILFVCFFIIAMVTVVMMLKLRQSSKSQKSAKAQEDLQQTASKQQRVATAKAEIKETEKKDGYSDPIEEAKVFLTYGLNKQAIDLLNKHLEKNPSDTAARKMLAKAQSGTAA